VVEDDDTVRQIVSKVLEAKGYKVSTANDGFDALLHLQQETPDVILSDLNMPQMSGFELLFRGTPQVSKDYGCGC
jgi:CheY-like chemotaxis protein